MILVPLLVGITILTVALATRRQVFQELEDLARQRRATDDSVSPLTEAFPHLQLWIPSGDAIYQATHSPRASKGPDIVFRPIRQELSDAA